MKAHLHPQKQCEMTIFFLRKLNFFFRNQVTYVSPSASFWQISSSDRDESFLKVKKKLKEIQIFLTVLIIKQLILNRVKKTDNLNTTNVRN